MIIWSEYCKLVPVENIGHILESPLWYNDKIGRGKVYFKSWYEKGIRVVQDIINENGSLYTFEQLKTLYNINGTFLHYHQLMNGISPLWINQIIDNHIFILENKTNAICNIYVKKLIKVKKGSRIFYDTFAEVDKYNPHGKWQTEIGDIYENEWKSYFLNIKKWHEIKI